MKELFSDYIDSPVGTVVIVVDGEEMCSLDFTATEQRMLALLRRRYGQFRLVPTINPCGFSDLVRGYFLSNYHCLDAIPVNTGGTPFQRQVWSALRTIPPGTTTTYGRLAAQLEKPTAYRAVGAANALNPVALVLPCHRVIGADSSLTGYAGGLACKQWLLQHEGYLLM
jgi:methylated-DNA-[protein]-cysteine S-methyltransferase